MRPVLTFIFLLLCGWGLVQAQSSPPPAITDYDNTALADSLWPGTDSAFCKGGSFTIHGMYFKRSQGGENWDTTFVYLGAYPGGTKAQVTGIATGGGGTNDRINVSLPDIFVQDTCLPLLVIKRTTLGQQTFTYSDTAQVCLIGDWASVVYPDSAFCVGDSNPLPVITLSDSASGAFCCMSGAPGFYVTPSSGSVILHQGAVGEDNSFWFQTDHPACGDSVRLVVDIRNPSPSVATYNGSLLPNFCQNAPANPVADTSLLQPSGGRFFAPSGEPVLADSLTGEIDLQSSLPGTHTLLYIPPDLCHDTVAISVTITAPASAQIIYPTIGLLFNAPHLCANHPTAIPVFNSGAQGGVWLSVPPGVAFGGVGEIYPGLSVPGTYDVCFLPPGWCADTVRVLTGLVIDSVPQSTITLASAQVCANDTVRVASLTGPGGGTFELLVNDSVVAQSLNQYIPLGGLAITGPAPYELRYFTQGNCSDTASASGTILPVDDPTFSYPPLNAFCISDPDPWPLIAGTGGGVFSAVTPATVVDPDGRLHLQASGAGQHTIRYLTAGPCPDSLEVQVWIISAASASFSYPASVFCQSDSNPWPVIQGTPGGTFTADSGLVIHPDSGWINLATSVADTYNVTYALTGNCNVSFSQTVIVLQNDSSTSIQYVQEQYCPDGINPRPLLLGDSVGRFIAGAGLVFANTDSGIIDLALTPPGGPYTVLYDVTNACAEDPVDSVWVLDFDNGFFSYSSNSFCQSDALLLPDSVATAGGAFSEPTGSVLFSNSATGEADLAASVPGGPYSISYTTAGDCPATFTQSISIFPRPTQTALTAHPGGTVCAGTQVTFRALGAGVATFEFQQNRTTVPSLFDLFQTDSLADGDSIHAILTTNLGCADTLGLEVEIKPIPQVGWTEWPYLIMDDVPFTITVPASEDSTVYHWSVTALGPVTITPDTGITPVANGGFTTDFSSLATLAHPLQPGQALIYIQPEARGCMGERDSLLLDVISGEEQVYVPEVMTPNHDGDNDTWLVRWRHGEDPADYTLRLHNRSGGQVFMMNPIHEYWDGGSLPDGVYWWTLTGPEGEIIQRSGLTIRRK